MSTKEDTRNAQEVLDDALTKIKDLGALHGFVLIVDTPETTAVFMSGRQSSQAILGQEAMKASMRLAGLKVTSDD